MNSATGRCLNTNRKDKTRFEVTEDLNSDPKFQRSVKIPIQFYLSSLPSIAERVILAVKELFLVS